ncbi:thiamine-phosphate kinase, partial [candidate division KSB1 bacterium]|nr:thiamine-phosphate kinase [candidate division KSB1 bacterium]
MDEPQKISEIGEFGLIDRLAQKLPQIHHDDLILGIGDDTAVIRKDDGHVILITCDIQVENQHFRLKNISPYQLGKRAMAVNLSDIAAMGGTPTFALVSMGVPGNFPLAHFDDLNRGMADMLAEFGAQVIGGNLSSTERDLIIDITLLGEAPAGKFLTRGGARPGDRIYVTGTPGMSGAGFAIIERYGTGYPPELAEFVKAHLEPVPRITAGIKLARSGIVTAMIDISDGIASDLNHICVQSNVGALLNQTQFPQPGAAERIETVAGKQFHKLALHSGEDYELLFTVKEDSDISMLDSIARETNTNFTKIGIIQPMDEGFWMIKTLGENI